jgi:prolyl-tRNA synthetase
MKMRDLFGQTLRDTPADADTASASLLMRAGFIRPLGAGIYSYLHLAKRSMLKIESILRDEMDKIGGQEITMPVVHPAETWKETGRWYEIGAEMVRFTDRNAHDMALAMTHEEVVADLVRSEIHSYKQLPKLIYHIQTKFRDEPRPRAGLIRTREFTMKDSYSLDADWQGLDNQYRLHYQAYFNIFHRCGLEVVAVRSDTGMMGGSLAHEFMFLNPIGEDTLLLCDSCGYSANRQVARFYHPPAPAEEIKPKKKVKTPQCKSIEELANFLSLTKSKTAKAVFFTATIPETGNEREKILFAIIRGDLELNETKLANAVKARGLRPSTEEEIISIGAVPGFASPIGLRPDPSRMLIIVDESIMSSTNLVAGANEADYHLLNTNVPRDYKPDLVADIAAAEEGFACPECKQPLRKERGVELGNIFKLGTRYSDKLGCTFLDQDGKQKPVIMGSYGIGIGRLLACVAEAYHDDQGLIWPATIAPFQVHLILLRGKGSPEAEKTAEKMYNDLQEAGMETLYDDRDESPGVKFSDADLIGIPIRLTVSERGLAQECFEMKLRSQSDKVMVPLESIVTRVKSEYATLVGEIEKKKNPVNYIEISSSPSNT